MKKIVAVTAVIIALTTVTVFAQTGGKMMSQEMIQDMSGMMTQMNEMMQKLSHPMRHMTVTEHAKMQDMAKIMRDMAAQMNEMAEHLDEGMMDSAIVKKMQEKMKAIDKSIERLQKEGK